MADKEFKSIFAAEFEEILKIKHECGYKYVNQEQELRRLDRYLESQGLDEKTLTKDICEKWCCRRENESLGSLKKRVTAIRELTKCLDTKGIPTFSMAHIIVRREPKYIAHIFTDTELSKFFKAADAYKYNPKRCAYHKYYPLFFRILYSSGLRPSELIMLKIKDYHFNESYITIYSGKNNKDRIVPIHPELTKRCLKMLEDEGICILLQGDEYLFRKSDNTHLSMKSLYYIFRCYLKDAGIRHLGKGKGPRVYDFRHTYSVNLLRKWVMEGKDLLNWLPYMQTMMGHESFSETAYYLKLTEQMFPTLMLKLEHEYPDLTKKDVIPDGEEFY